MLAPSGIFRLWDVVHAFPAAEAEDPLDQWCATGSSVGGGRTRAELEEQISMSRIRLLCVPESTHTMTPVVADQAVLPVTLPSKPVPWLVPSSRDQPPR